MGGFVRLPGQLLFKPHDSAIVRDRSMLVGVGVASVGQPRVPLVGVLLLLTIALVQLVVLIGSGAEEGETALGAVEGANVVVALLVVVEVALGYELLGALAALERSLVLVGSDVHLQIPLLGEALLADRAFERLHSVVFAGVDI